MAEFEADIHLALRSVATTLNFDFTLQRIEDSASLSFHRPRAPEVAFALLCPLTSSWSRSRMIPGQGPPMLRTRAWPLGVLGLPPELRHQVEKDNDHLSLSLEIAEVLRRQFTPWILSFPEQFGNTVNETPATIWDLSELVLWAELHKLWRFALNQCEFGEVHRRPTGILTNTALRERRLSQGWPKLRARPDLTSEYLGPLQKTCACREAHQPARLRQRGPPWNATPLKGFLTTIFRSTFHRELLTGRGTAGDVAIDSQDKGVDKHSLGTLSLDSTLTGVPPTEHSRAQLRRNEQKHDSDIAADVFDTDSDATVPEPSSPQFAIELPSLAQCRDLRLCNALNITRKDRVMSSLVFSL